MDRFGISTTFSAFENGGQTLDELCRDETRMLIIETPTNPLLSIHDITELSAAAKARGILVLVDNTFATPLLQRPLDLGADIVIHSTTKYIGGHSDLIGGMAVVRDSKLAERLRFLQNAVGAIPGPWDCFLTLRGLRTLAVRMERHCSNATLLADRLADHPRVLELLYPGLQTHPGHAVAAQQMGGQFGGMLSLQVEGGAAGARRFVAELRHFTLAESLGGVESLVNHPLTMTHASMPEEDRLARGFSAGLLRLSVGIEHPEDLWKDIERALSA
jgi:cystathionine beta-lyase/cystathionine gamma-synthase